MERRDARDRHARRAVRGSVRPGADRQPRTAGAHRRGRLHQRPAPRAAPRLLDRFRRAPRLRARRRHAPRRLARVRADRSLLREAVRGRHEREPRGGARRVDVDALRQRRRSRSSTTGASSRRRCCTSRTSSAIASGSSPSTTTSSSTCRRRRGTSSSRCTRSTGSATPQPGVAGRAAAHAHRAPRAPRHRRPHLRPLRRAGARSRRPCRPLRFRGHDVIVFHVLDPAEIDFPFDEAASFEDLESGDRMPVVPEALREQYRALVQAHIAALGRLFTDSRIDYALFNTSVPLDHALFHYLVDARAPEPGAVMSFLAPALLAALAAIAIPIVVHLIQRERRRVVAVSVADVPAQDPVPVGEAPRHPPLAAARCCASPRSRCSSLAFARPFLARRGSGRRGRRRRARWSSCSTVRTAWATAAAGPARRRRRGRSSASSARPTAARWCSSPRTWRSACARRRSARRLVAAIDRAAPGAGRHAVRPGAARGGRPARIVARCRAARSCSISDFQKSGWDRAQETRLPPGVSLRTVPVGEADDRECVDRRAGVRAPGGRAGASASRRARAS